MTLTDYINQIQYEISERLAIMEENKATPEQISQETQTRRREYITKLRHEYKLSLGDAAKQTLTIEKEV